MKNTKVRSWNKNENKFFYFQNGRYFKDSECKRCISERVCSEFDWNTSEWFTCLKDKNGVDIYEGDIVRILYTDWGSKPESDPRTLQQYLDDISYVAKVVFQHNSWMVSIWGEKYKEWHFDSITPGKYGFIEVIGNIHDNPDLLNNQ